MWYFVEKNGKAVKAYKNEKRALDYAKTRVPFDSLKDRLLVVRQDGEILLDLCKLTNLAIIKNNDNTYSLDEKIFVYENFN